MQFCLYKSQQVNVCSRPKVPVIAIVWLIELLFIACFSKIIIIIYYSYYVHRTTIVGGFSVYIRNSFEKRYPFGFRFTFQFVKMMCLIGIQHSMVIRHLFIKVFRLLLFLFRTPFHFDGIRLIFRTVAKSN